MVPEIRNNGIGIAERLVQCSWRRAGKGPYGFTMIELVVVIAVIGILAAIAVPRFIDLQNQARLSVRDGFTGNLRSAASLAYAQAAVNNNTLNLNAASVLQQFVHTGAVTLSGNTFSANVHGTAYSWSYTYPAQIGDPTP